MANILGWKPIPPFTFNENDAGEYRRRQIGRYLVNPREATISAEGHGGITASVVRNTLVINESGTLSDDPYVVLTATRDSDIARVSVPVQIFTAQQPTFEWSPIAQVTKVWMLTATLPARCSLISVPI